MNEPDLIHVATVHGPLGLKGEIKITTFLENKKIFMSLSPFFLENKNNIIELKVIKIINNKVIIKIKDLSNREEISKIVGKKIFINKNKLPKSKKNEFYIFDLIGSKVITKNNQFLGYVKNIENYGSDDLIKIYNKNKKEILLPVNNENIVSINLEKKIIITDPIKGILQLA